MRRSASGAHGFGLRQRLACWSVLLALLATTGACGQRASVNFKVTVNVNDNGTRRTGWSVWQFNAAKGFPQGYAVRLRGDAIAVDLPGRGTLFATLHERNDNGGLGSRGRLGLIPEAKFGDLERQRRRQPRRHKSRVDDLREIAAQEGASARLECVRNIRPYANFCPFMVRFRDPMDPTTVEAVDPADLGATFGPGVTLESIEVTITRAPITRTAEQRLPWLDSYRNRVFDDHTGAIYSSDNELLVRRIRVSAFTSR